MSEEFRLTEGSTERVLIVRNGYNRSAVLRLVEGSPIIQLDDSANGVYIRGHNQPPDGVTAAGSLQFGRVENVRSPNPTLIPRLHIGGDGKVGVGTETPGALLHVEGGQNNEWGMIVHSTGGSALGLKISSVWFDHDLPVFQVNALDSNGKDVPRFDVRANGHSYFYDNNGSPTIHMDPNHGDIALLGADCAEDFDVDETELLDPGTVMIIGSESQLRRCEQAYDNRVAGVLSGAGDYRPGIVLGRQKSNRRRLPLALTGKVFCKVDASYAAIEVGDLLTTAPTPGHAMKVLDPLKAFGAVIGKALRPLGSGQDLVPILIALQ